MNLHITYRPASFDEVVGNQNLIEILKGILSKKEAPHAFLFHGPTGCGKTTLGRIVAQELGASGNDLREVDSADFRGIDTIREIRKQGQFKPLEGNCKVWILDECHKLSNDAQNALLKALEDSPPHVYYVLCTTDPQKLIATIRGRCSQYQVSALTDLEMKKLLRRVVKEEGETLDKEIYEQIITDAMGHPRDALQVLSQVLSVDGEKRAEVAKRTAEQNNQTIELCRALFSNTGWKKIADILNGLKGQEPETIRRAILGYAQSILLKKDDMKIANTMDKFIDPFYDSGFPGLVFACYSATHDDLPF